MPDAVARDELLNPSLLVPVPPLLAETPEEQERLEEAKRIYENAKAEAFYRPSLEETAAATPTPKIFQLYVHGDDDWTADMIRRIKDSGYAALALTVDVAHYSRRERPMLSRYMPPTRRPGSAPERRWRSSAREPSPAGLRRSRRDGPMHSAKRACPRR